MSVPKPTRGSPIGIDEPLPVPLVKKLIAVRLRQAFPAEGPHPPHPEAASPATAELAGPVCLALPEVTERLSHGAPTWFVRGKRAFETLWAHGHHDHDFPHLWCAGPLGAQQELVASEPGRFFRPPYVGGRGWIGVRLDTGLDWAEVSERRKFVR
jgi:hypothetical protein